VENDQTPKPSKGSEAGKLKNGSKGESPKRQRKAMYLPPRILKKLEIVKNNSSYENPKDLVIFERLLDNCIYNKQDAKESSEKLATQNYVDKSNKKHNGKLNAAFEIFQTEAFQNNQFLQQVIKQLSEQMEELLKRSKPAG
jgi:hypothetical protein